MLGVIPLSSSILFNSPNELLQGVSKGFWGWALNKDCLLTKVVELLTVLLRSKLKLGPFNFSKVGDGIGWGGKFTWYAAYSAYQYQDNIARFV